MARSYLRAIGQILVCEESKLGFQSGQHRWLKSRHCTLDTEFHLIIIAKNRESNLSANWATEVVNNLVETHINGGYALDSQNLIAGFEASGTSWSVFQGVP